MIKKKKLIAGMILVMVMSTVGLINPVLALKNSSIDAATGEKSSLSDSDAIISRNLDRYLTVLTDAGRFSGAVQVMRGDTVILSKGYGMGNYEFSVPNTPQTVFPIASNTKQLTAAAILKLQEQGRLNLTDPVTKFIPNATNWKDIRISHLLNHTSGIHTDGGFLPTDPESFTLPEIIGMINTLPLDFEPGTNHTYSNNGYITLSYIIEQASGMPYEEYMKKTFFQPLGMNSTGQDNARNVFINRSSGYTTLGGEQIHYDLMNIHNTYGAGCMHSTVEDLSRWLQAFNTPGVILSPESYKTMIDNQYGINAHVVQNLTMIWHSGRQFGFVSQTYSIPDDKISLVYLTNHDRTPTGTLTKDLVSIVYNKPYTLPGRQSNYLMRGMIRFL
ncbi:MAG: beta-lactamase family protein [Methanospirillum sp.]|nr:beta-lactamase family protein [Methanospirillum sp.]